MAVTSKRIKFGGGEARQRVFAPCRSQCPVHLDVPGYLGAIAEGRFSDALQIVLERNPLPSVCGRVCLHPCEDGCRRCNLDDPVAIARLKRAASDFGVYPAFRAARPRPERIAVVGGGPAGLTVAHDLVRRGLQVTVYESKARLGGMLRYGIPNYRLTDHALDRDIDYIRSGGVEVITGVRIGDDLSLEELRTTHDAVVVTAGLQGSRPLPIPGTHHLQVLAALPFLEAAAAGERVEIGARVVVVGGGNVAMDVARTARRLGADSVTVVCLENADEMPASEHEVDEARGEGVQIQCSWGPREVCGEERVSGLKVTRCASVFDAEKRFSPVFDESCTEQFDADTVIFATGQFADVGDLGVELSPRGMIVVDPLTLHTSVPGVYAAGDVVSGPTRIIDAIAAGHRAAACVLRDLIGDSAALDDLNVDSVELGHVSDTMMSKLENRRRVQMERLECYEAVKTFDEIEQGYTEYEAAREAQRCLRCASGARLSFEKCAVCLTCVRVCPHNAPSVMVGNIIDFDTEACHACGACASQCPARAISIEGQSDEEMHRRVELMLTNPALDTTIVFACGSTPYLPSIPGVDIRTLTVSCLLRVSEAVVLRALRAGASHVVFTGCVESGCRYPDSRELVDRGIAKIRDVLSQIEMHDVLMVLGARDEEELHLR